MRKQEHTGLMKEGWDDLKGPKYDWLTNLRNLTRKRQCAFKVLRSSTLKTAVWRQWYAWAICSRLAPSKAVARIIKKHLWGHSQCRAGTGKQWSFGEDE